MNPDSTFLAVCFGIAAALLLAAAALWPRADAITTAQRATFAERWPQPECEFPHAPNWQHVNWRVCQSEAGQK